MIYISARENDKYSGVYKKIRGQIEGLRTENIEVELIECTELPKWKKALPFSSRSYKWKEIEIPSDADVIYIRYQLSDFPFIKTLKKWKNMYPGIEIILEMPIYPYVHELKEISNKLTLFRDLFYSKFIHKYVSRIVTFTSHEEIYGVKTIPMVNGIEVDKIKPKATLNSECDSINMIAVALINFSHGYDRILAGLKQYYIQDGIKKNIIFHIIGDGEIVPSLKEYVKKNSLDKHVFFYGFKSGKELDDLYDKADIGVDVLGGHRKGDIWFGTLKSREYLSKGLPFITEYKLPDNVKMVEKYILNVPADESPIDMNRVIEFYTKLLDTDPVLEMRAFAKTYCDISVVMEPLADYIKKGK